MRAIDPAELRTGDRFALTEGGSLFDFRKRVVSPSGSVTTLSGFRFERWVDVIVLRGEKVWVAS